MASCASSEGPVLMMNDSVSPLLMAVSQRSTGATCRQWDAAQAPASVSSSAVLSGTRRGGCRRPRCISRTDTMGKAISEARESWAGTLDPSSHPLGPLPPHSVQGASTSSPVASRSAPPGCPAARPPHCPVLLVLKEKGEENKARKQKGSGWAPGT